MNFEPNPKAPNLLPAEYQGEIDAQNQKRALAQALLAMSQRMPQGQMVSGHYVKSSPLEALAPLLAAYKGRGQDQEAATAIRDVRMKARTAEQGDLQNLDPESAEKLTAGLKSPFSTVSGPAKDLLKALHDRRQNAFNQGAPVSTPQSVLAAQGDPTKLQAAGPPTQSTTPAIPGQPFMDPTGRKMPVFPPQAPQTNVNFGNQLRTKEYDRLADPKERGPAQSASEGLAIAADAMNILHSGQLNTGQGADAVTAIQKAAKWLGQPVDPKASGSELYKSLVIPMVGKIIQMFGAGTGLSDADREAAMKGVANNTLEPDAAKRILNTFFRKQMTTIKMYNDQVVGASEGDQGEVFRRLAIPFSATLEKYVPDPLEGPVFSAPPKGKDAAPGQPAKDPIREQLLRELQGGR